MELTLFRTFIPRILWISYIQLVPYNCGKTTFYFNIRYFNSGYISAYRHHHYANTRITPHHRTTQAIADCDNSPIAAIQQQLSALELKMDRHHALVNSATPQAWSRVRDHSRGRPPRDYRITRTPEPVPYERDHSAPYVSSSSPCRYKNQRTLPNH